MSTQEILEGIADNEAALILSKLKEEAIYFGLDDRHAKMLEQATSYKTLRLVAFSTIRKMKKVRGEKAVAFCSGPLRNGGKGLGENITSMLSEIRNLNKDSICFNQLLFFTKIMELERLFPDKDAMEEFFLPIIASGDIDLFKRCQHFTESENALRELATAKSSNLEIV